MLKRIATSTFAIMCAFSIENYGIAMSVPSTPEQWAEYNANPSAWAEKYGPQRSKMESVNQSTAVAPMPKPNQSNPSMQPIQTMQAAPVATSMPAKPRIGTVILNNGNAPVQPVPSAIDRTRIGVVVPNLSMQPSTDAPTVFIKPRIGIPMQPVQVSNPPMQSGQSMQPPALSGNDQRMHIMEMNDQHMYQDRMNNQVNKRMENRNDERSNRSMNPDNPNKMMNTQNTQNVMQGKMVPPEQRRTAGNGQAYNQ